MSEDCLSLSIWVPAKAAEDPARSKLLIIVWITGGAFLVGGTTVPYQNPTPWDIIAPSYLSYSGRTHSIGVPQRYWKIKLRKHGKSYTWHLLKRDQRAFVNLDGKI